MDKEFRVEKISVQLHQLPHSSPQSGGKKCNSLSIVVKQFLVKPINWNWRRCFYGTHPTWGSSSIELVSRFIFPFLLSLPGVSPPTTFSSAMSLFCLWRVLSSHITRASSFQGQGTDFIQWVEMDKGWSCDSCKICDCIDALLKKEIDTYGRAKETFCWESVVFSGKWAFQRSISPFNFQVQTSWEQELERVWIQEVHLQAFQLAYSELIQSDTCKLVMTVNRSGLPKLPSTSTGDKCIVCLRGIMPAVKHLME